MRIIIISIVLLFAFFPKPVSSGVPPECNPPETVESAIQAADLIVVVKTLKKTQKSAALDSDALATSFLVEQILKGNISLRSIIHVQDCAHWKCANHIFRKDEQAILLLRKSRDGNYFLPGWTCARSFSRGVLPMDEENPKVRELMKALKTKLIKKSITGQENVSLDR